MLPDDLKKGLHKSLLAASLFLVLGAAQAATTYTFPGHLPSTCSGSAGTYVCNGLNLSYQDTILIASPKPATITINGNFSTNQNQINAAGAASDLTFIVTGTLDLNWNSVLNANVRAHKLDGDSSVTIGGDITAEDDITLGYQAQVGGAIHSTSGKVQISSSVTVSGGITADKDVTINSNSQVGGAVISTSGKVDVSSSVSIGGGITAEKDVTVNSDSQVGGAIASADGDVEISTSVTVNGSVSADEDITIGSQSQIAGDVTSASEDIQLSSNVTVTGSLLAEDNISLGFQDAITGSIRSTSGKIQTNGEVSITGDVFAPKDVEIGERSQIAGSITTTSHGDVTLYYRAVVCGDITTDSGDVDLASEAKVGGNIASDSGDVTLGWLAQVGGSVTTGGSVHNNGGTINDSGVSLPAFCASYFPGGSAPSGFNAFETSTAANAVTGVIKTKVAGESFNLAVVALDDTPAVKTDFESTVSIQLVNGSGSTDCASRSAIGAVGSVSFSMANQGRVNVAFTESNAWQDVLVRMTYVPTSGSAVVACSTDHFAIRPDVLAVAVTDNDWETAGTARTLNSSTADGNVTHKAGKPFTVTATAYNKAGAITSNYAGAPAAVFVRSQLPYQETCTSCTLSGVSFGGSGGTVVSHTGQYSEVGVFVMALQDLDFAAIDAGDGSTQTERMIGSDEITVGRFIPDHFTLLAGSTVAAACMAGGFTYMDQPFNRLTFTVESRNAGDAVTQNYNDTLARGMVAVVAENADSGTGLQTRLEGIPGTAWASGRFIFDAADIYFRRRTIVKDASVEPDGPFDALQFGLNLSDPDGVLLEGRNMNAATSGDCIAAGNCDSQRIGDISGSAQTTRVRFGRLKLSNAYGSERLSLPMSMVAQFYNGSFFATNTLDSCTVIATANLAMHGYTGGVDNTNMSVAQNAGIGTPIVDGAGQITLAPPNPSGAAGGVTLCVALDNVLTPACNANTPAALPWLRGRWTPGNAAYTDDPTGHASFGMYKNSSQGSGTTIYMRELY